MRSTYIVKIEWSNYDFSSVAVPCPSNIVGPYRIAHENGGVSHMRYASTTSGLGHACFGVSCNIVQMVNVAVCLLQAGDTVFREALRLGYFILL